MSKKTCPWLLIAVVSSMLIFTSTGNAAPATNLNNLQESFFMQKKRLLNNYLNQLNTLKTYILSSSDPIGATEVRVEINKIEDEIRMIPQPIVSFQPATAAPAPRPVIKKRSPKTHSSEVE
ncbi:MAG: hypothetical protein KAS94_15505, partial [Desulfobulbaceae bacterium]|nr:hypothetical protein [Desulfobulbaceae bacterium]